MLALVWSRGPRRPTRPELDRVRLQLAQHWARGGLLSQESEGWRPVCVGLAIACLAVDSLEDLDRVLDEVSAEAADPRVAPIFREAMAELKAAKNTGKVDNSDNWPRAPLYVSAREWLLGAIGHACRIVSDRSAGS